MKRLLAVMLSLLASPAYAWGPAGHALIGKIADQLLAGTHAGHRVDQVLGTYTLEEAAKWPDCVRSVHKEASGDFKFVPDRYTRRCTAFETPQGEARMEDYARRNWDTFPYRAGHGDHEAYHFADIPIEDGSYSASDIGASDHDVVHAIIAAIDELEWKAVPAPFSIKDDKEAILMLAHFVGDIHQPLHVGVVYLDPQGDEVDPHSENEAEADSTAGGNLIQVGRSSELHAQWDGIQKKLEKEVPTLVTEARETPINTAIPIEQWPVRWASESVFAAQEAYSGMTFSPDAHRSHRWRAHFEDRHHYLTFQHDEQRVRIIEAGARLAAVVQAIWP